MQSLILCSIILIGSVFALPQRSPSYAKGVAKQYSQATSSPSRASSPSGNFIPAGFRNNDEDEEEYEDNTPSLTQQVRRPSPPPYEDNYPASVPQYRPLSPQAPQKPYRKVSGQSVPRKQLLDDDKELEDEPEEPDRLSLLLPNSKFECNGKNTGYYADEGLDCEVFHYCQEGTKHSWICPEGFTFHQIHLICMPPSGDNICQKSSEYHFVNDYLYKPLNVEEHENKPNVTLKYSERFYPENYFYAGNVQHDEEEYEQPRRTSPAPQYHRRPQAQQQQPQQQHFTPSLRPESHFPVQFRPTPTSQVFHSPEEVNISLQQRRPIFLATPRPPISPTPYPSHREAVEFEYHK